MDVYDKITKFGFGWSSIFHNKYYNLIKLLNSYSFLRKYNQYSNFIKKYID